MSEVDLTGRCEMLLVLLLMLVLAGMMSGA